jgi:hypothetical protein
VKTCGRLVKHARYYWLLLAGSHLTRRIFWATVRRIAGGRDELGGRCGSKIGGEGGEGRTGLRGRDWNDGTSRVGRFGTGQEKLQLTVKKDAWVYTKPHWEAKMEIPVEK